VDSELTPVSDHIGRGNRHNFCPWTQSYYARAVVLALVKSDRIFLSYTERPRCLRIDGGCFQWNNDFQQMLKTANSVKISALERDAASQLMAVLLKVPFLESAKFQRESTHGAAASSSPELQQVPSL